jgi:prepilin signal peptidase PulO-like enzyme (type II secretory pathway)
MIIPNIFFQITILIFGLLIGSFLNSVIWRISVKKSVADGRSICPKCKHELGFFDLIPIFSFIFLKGKCRYCKKSISWQYPLVEIATGVIFFSISIFFFSNLPLMIFLLIASSCLIVIFVYDLKHLIIPDVILVPAIIISLIYRITEILFITKDYSQFLYYLLAIIIPCGFFLILYLLSKGKWIGFGDVKLGVLLGLILGWPNILVGLFLSYLIGGIIGTGLIILKKKKIKSEVPFAPFLITGTTLAIFFGPAIIDWYLNLLL